MKALQKAILTVTFSLVILVGAGVYGSLVFSGNPHDLVGARTQQLADPKPARTPASLVVGAGETLATLDTMERMVTVDLRCVKPGPLAKITSTAKQMRIVGRHCPNGRSEPYTGTQIINRTNGYTATTFRLPNTHFSSDYIYLAKGSNTILLTVTGEHGEKTLSELTVIRE